MKLIFTRNISFPGNILDEVIKEISGNFTVRTTPVPIPNTAVKSVTPKVLVGRLTGKIGTARIKFKAPLLIKSGAFFVSLNLICFFLFKYMLPYSILFLCWNIKLKLHVFTLYVIKLGRPKCLSQAE